MPRAHSGRTVHLGAGPSQNAGDPPRMLEAQPTHPGKPGVPTVPHQPLWPQSDWSLGGGSQLDCPHPHTTLPPVHCQTRGPTEGTPKGQVGFALIRVLMRGGASAAFLQGHNHHPPPPPPHTLMRRTHTLAAQDCWWRARALPPALRSPSPWPGQLGEAGRGQRPGV